MGSGDFPFRKVAILGTGLMGGSLAGALKRLPVPPEIVGTSKDPIDTAEALARGWVDRIEDRNDDAVKGADLIVLAVPPSVISTIMDEISASISSSSTVTDLCSVKGSLFEEYKSRFSTKFPKYTSSHPMAGSERTGMTAARADLFLGKTVFLTPFGSERIATENLSRMWESLGARTLSISPEEHDGIVAHISHLPHVLSYCLLDLVEKVKKENRFSGFDWQSQKGGSFTDILRIAHSSPTLWSDILYQNRSAILDALEHFDHEIKIFQSALQQDDSKELSRLLLEWTAPLSETRTL